MWKCSVGNANLKWKNKEWRNYLIDYNTQQGKEKLKSVAGPPSVMISKADKKYTDELHNLFGYDHKQKISKWLIYY